MGDLVTETNVYVFRTRILDTLNAKSFDRDQAMSLSAEIHEFEINGGQLKASEDRLWLKLTEKILEV